MYEYRDEFTDILGAYALDAVDSDERDRIEDHMRSCKFCTTEVHKHREVAALLGPTAVLAPEGVWDRIAAALSPPAPPVRMSFRPTGEVDPLAEPKMAADTDPSAEHHRAPVIVRIGAARRSIRMRTFTALAGVAAAVVVALGGVAVHQNQRLDDMNQALIAARPRPGGAVSALAVDLEGPGETTAQVVVNPDGQGHLFAGDLPAPDGGEVYQLWGQIDGRVLSLGTFGRDTEVVPFQVDPDHLGDVQAFAVTAERSPGVTTSGHDPVAVGETA